MLWFFQTPISTFTNKDVPTSPTELKPQGANSFKKFTLTSCCSCQVAAICQPSNVILFYHCMSMLFLTFTVMQDAFEEIGYSKPFWLHYTKIYREACVNDYKEQKIFGHLTECWATCLLLTQSRFLHSSCSWCDRSQVQIYMHKNSKTESSVLNGCSPCISPRTM